MAETNLKKNKEGYGYKYTDLAEIHNYLEDNEMRYIQKIQRLEDDDYIFTKRYINGEWEKEWIQGCRVVQATLNGKSNPAQEQGSALTYARRYSLLLAFGLATEDDDGEKLTRPVTKPKTESRKINLKELGILQQTIAKYNLTDERINEILAKFGYKKLDEVDFENYAKVGNEMSK